jgi:hypothetical protein
MSQEEGLKAFEAALAALVPRGDRLDRDRLMFLAGQASVGGILSETATAEGAPGVSPVPGKIHGQEARAMRRWAWPAAFSAMTAVAATLFVMLLMQAGPPSVVNAVPEGTGIDKNRVVQQGPGPEAPPAGEQQDSRLPGSSETPLPETPWASAAGRTILAMGPLGRVRLPEVTERLLAAGVPQALDRVFAEGPGPGAALQPGVPLGVQESPAPATYRNLRDDLLETPGPARSSLRPSVKEMLNPQGDKS